MRAIAILLLALAGCAAQPVQSGASQPKSSAAVHTELGAGYYSRGQYAVALQELNAALKADPSYAQAYNMLGLVYMTLRENTTAEENFGRALNLNPRDSDINNNYGWFLCQTGRAAQSIKHFQIALANPLYATPEKAYLNAGICAVRMKDDRHAEIYYHEALQAQPKLAMADLGLAGIYYRDGSYKRARMYLSSYMKMAAPSAASLWLGIRIEHALGGSDAEADYAEQLRNRFPDSSEAQDLRDGKFQ